MKEEIKFLGHKFNDVKAEINNETKMAIANFKRPKNKKAIQAFLGFINWDRRFIKNLVRMTQPLEILRCLCACEDSGTGKSPSQERFRCPDQAPRSVVLDSQVEQSPDHPRHIGNKDRRGCPPLPKQVARQRLGRGDLPSGAGVHGARLL